MEKQRPAQRPKSSQLAKLVRNKILTGAYQPGTPLLQDAIAAEFGVSRIPIREVLVQLSAEGLVDVFRRGFQVRPLSLAEAEEVFNLRLQIEPRACAEGAARARRQDHVEAMLALEQLNQHLAESHHEDYGDLNREFHIALLAPRQQPVTAEILNRLLTISQRYAQRHIAALSRATRVTKEHSQLFRAWQAGMTEEVEHLARDHIEAVRKDLIKLLRDAK